MLISWTQRMSDVDLAEKRLTAELGKRPTLQRVGDELGLSRESIRRYRWKIEQHYNQQWVRRAFFDQHVRLWRLWVFENTANVLPLIIAAAEGRGAKPPKRKEPFAPTRKRLPPQLQRVKVTTFMAPSERQEALQERARHCHWSEVVYVNGTDIISHINRRR